MKTPKQQFGFNQKLLVLALLSVFGAVHAEETAQPAVKTEIKGEVKAPAAKAEEGDEDGAVEAAKPAAKAEIKAEAKAPAAKAETKAPAAKAEEGDEDGTEAAAKPAAKAETKAPAAKAEVKSTAKAPAAKADEGDDEEGDEEGGKKDADEGPSEADLMKIPVSTVRLGLGAVSGDSNDRTIFSQYNGLRDDNANLLLDIDFVKLNAETGFWTKFKVRDLGLDTRELDFSQQKQGDWKYSVGYNEIVRHDLRTINTGMLGAGSTTPTVESLATPGSGKNLDLELKRKGLTFGAEKWLTNNLLFEASFKNEDKDGARLSGVGLTCSTGGAFVAISRYLCGNTGAMLMLPEPVHSSIRQFEAKLNFSGDKFLLSGGYYGSFYSNDNGSMTPTVNGNLLNPNGTSFDPAAGSPNLLNYLQQRIALPPDNQAHQFYVSGNYAFTPTTHATFKYAYTHATQDDSFSNMGAPAGVSNLGGEVNTNLAQIGLTARPMAKLSVLANVRYEDKNDDTPVALYNLNADTPPVAYTNDLNSSQKLNGKLEATYQFPYNYRATLGVDYASVHRDLPRGGAAISDLLLSLSALREETQELGYRAQLQRAFSESLIARISYEQSQRDGDSWTKYNLTGSAYPMTMMDRQRDKVKLSADWSPTDKLSLQFMFEDGNDEYSGSARGLRDTGMRSYGIDAAWSLSDKWKLTGYANRSEQTLHVDNAGYLAELEDVSTSLGIGVVGTPTPKLGVGGTLSYMNDSNRYKLDMAAAPGLPDASYRVTSLKLYGKYALKENADIRADLVYQHASFDEWTWSNNGTRFAYSDNTTVTMNPNQSVGFLGISYIYKFR